LVIENGVTEIGPRAFKNNADIAGTVTVPNSVTEIGIEAFYGMYSLDELILPIRFYPDRFGAPLSVSVSYN
jgi:hypothetical protein